MKSLLAITFKLVIINYFVAGAVISSILQFIANTCLVQNDHIYRSAQKVEWGYAFDIHCNAFFPFFLCVYVVQFCFLPLTTGPLIRLVIGNLVYVLGAWMYVYISYLGYCALPFLHLQVVILYPFVALLLGSLVISFAFNFNISHHVLDYYF
ncbi:Protein unc-50-like protein [Smittium mucronatum]|uniref:Protein unc-50-like protein n=1 Tax=Smittium mucronatum TaxID=133383 RepID=A0A1R0GVT7_9FUNG|nr:Protein unc-50-like protein [Smittium mucronatum]